MPFGREPAGTETLTELIPLSNENVEIPELDAVAVPILVRSDGAIPCREACVQRA